MLWMIDDPAAVLRLGVDYLAEETSSARGDGALMTRADPAYMPQIVVGDCEDEATIRSTRLETSSIGCLWENREPQCFDRVRNNRRLSRFGSTFDRIGSTSMMATSIRSDDIDLGVLCLNETDGQRSYQRHERRVVREFVELDLAPILITSVRRTSTDLSLLSDAERRVVELFSMGASHMEIALILDRSPRTIENQLRSARRKVGARNGIDLVRWWTEHAALV